MCNCGKLLVRSFCRNTGRTLAEIRMVDEGLLLQDDLRSEADAGGNLFSGAVLMNLEGGIGENNVISGAGVCAMAAINGLILSYGYRLAEQAMSDDELIVVFQIQREGERKVKDQQQSHCSE